MNLRSHLSSGLAIPAQPLALDHERRFSERYQRAITRYYFAAGVGGLAVGVHSTQFEIREPHYGLFQPVLELAARTIQQELARAPRDFVLISGVCGPRAQAVREAELAKRLGYQAVLLSFSALAQEPDETLLEHARAVGEILPVIGFYLQPAVGGRVLSCAFWRRLAEIPSVIAIKIAPFNRYATIDVIRAVVEAGRDDLSLYTGNDDTIVSDLLTRFSFERDGQNVSRQIDGGLLGHWGVWTRAAVKLLDEIKEARRQPTLDPRWLTRAGAVTDMNAAVFDAANRFAGCLPGILEVLRLNGLAPTSFCLNPHEQLSPGQAEELARVAKAYPELTDGDFIAEGRDRWLS